MSKQPVAASLTSISLEPVPEEDARHPTHQSDSEGPPARAGKAALTLRIDPVLHRDLRAAAFKQDTTIQNLILRALRKDGFKSAVPDR
jgi:predicted HicB family RNase H-like nuclease